MSRPWTNAALHDSGRPIPLSSPLPGECGGRTPLTAGPGCLPPQHPVPPWVLLRYQPGVVGRCARTVHVAPLPIGGAGEAKALCGALLSLEQVEAVTPGHGMPCTSCLLSPRLTESMSMLPTENLGPACSPQDSTDLTPQRAAAQYQAWGWPVTLRGDHVCLRLDGNAVALIIAVPLATRLAGTLFLPPTATARGAITWIHPAVPHALQLCRELDVITAIRAVQRGSPPPHDPPGDERLPVRSPGAHLHPQLRRPPVTTRGGENGGEGGHPGGRADVR